MKENETHFAIIYKEVEDASGYMVVFDVDTATAESTVKEMADKCFYVVFVASYMLMASLITSLYF